MQYTAGCIFMPYDRRSVLRAVGTTVVGVSVAGSGTAAASNSGTYTAEYYDGRLYKKYVPAGVGEDDDTPLVVMLHGCGQSPDQFKNETQMNAVADDEDFVVIYPDQTTSANADECWNWFEDEHTTRGNGEAALITGMVRQTIEREPISHQRVYVAGLSAGAAMVPNLLAAYPDVYAAGGVHSGLEYDAADNTVEAVAAMETGGPDPQRQGTKAYEAMNTHDVVSRVPTIVFHGTEDNIVQPVNGRQVTEQATQTNDLADDETDDDNVDYEADETSTGSTSEYDYTVLEYHDEKDRSVVETWWVEGMGHGWSGGMEGGEDTEPGGPDASRAIWDFFDGKIRTFGDHS